MTIGDREVPLPRHDRQRRGEPRRLGSRRVDDHLGVEHLVATVHGVRRRSVAPRMLAHGGAGRARLVEQPRRRRAAGRPRRRPARAARPRARAADSARASRVRADRAPRSRSPCSRRAAASRAPHRARARPPPPRSCRTRRTPPRAAASGASSRHSATESVVSASCAGESSITTRWPIPAAVAPLAAYRASSTSTRSPSPASARAHAAPTIPAPTTIASYCAREPRASRIAEAAAEGIARIEAERRVCSHERRAAHVRHERAVGPLRQPAGEHAPRDALLPPVLPDARAGRAHAARPSSPRSPCRTASDRSRLPSRAR